MATINFDKVDKVYLRELKGLDPKELLKHAEALEVENA